MRKGHPGRFVPGDNRSHVISGIITPADAPGHPPAMQRKGKMNSSVRRSIQMGTHARDVNASRPDTDPGAVAAAGKLGGLLDRAEVLLVAQREGLLEVHAASKEKEKLRREILAGPIANLSAVGKVAAKEQHELRSTFRFQPSASSFLAFSTAGRSMAAEAEIHREVLIKHGLATPMLEQLGQLLDRFDAAVAMGTSGRSKHVGATRELKTIATEIVQTVRVLDPAGIASGSRTTDSSWPRGSVRVR